MNENLIKKKLIDLLRIRVAKVLALQLVIILIAISNLYAQNTITVTGSIKDEQGLAMPGVSIIIKGTSKSVISKDNGAFSIVAGANDVLVFSFVGYLTKEVEIKGNKSLSVILNPNAQSLNQIVVVGFGTQTKKSIVGSISSVKSSEIEKSVVPSFESALQGRVPGLNITQANGVPGGQVTVRLRGTTSINAASEPLYVLDGIPINSGGRGDAGGGVSGNFGSSNNVLADINPNDIASIEVLKDASSTAIFGARGGAGVILITTKRGLAGQTKLSAGYSFGLTNETNRLSYLNGSEYLTLLDEAYQNSGNSGKAPVPTRPQFSRAIAEGTNSDHLSTVLRQGARQEANISASGGTEKSNFYIGSTYYQENGIIKGNDYEKIAFRSSIDNKATDKLKIGASINLSYTTDYRMGSGTNTEAGGFGLAQTTIPVYPYYNADGSYFDPYNNGLGSPGVIGRNLVMFQDRNEFYSRQKKLRTIGNAYIDYNIINKLVFHSDFGLDIYTQAIENYYSKNLRTLSNSASVPIKAITGPLSPGQPGALSRNERVSLNNYNLNNTLTYSNTFATNHGLKILGGFNYNRNNSPFLAVQGEGYPNDIFRDPSQATYKYSPSGSNSDKYLFVAMFGRINYDYKKRYLLEVSYRREGSSRFGRDHKYGDFPAIGAGWVVSDEAFMKNLTAINFLKIRSSLGITGSTGGIQNYQSYNQWKNAGSDNLGAYKGNPYFFSEQVANPDLRWEKQTQFDVGLEFGLLNNRLSGSIDYYNKKAKDLLLEFPGGSTQGQENPNIVLNQGALRNRGIEFSLSSINIQNTNFKWSTDFNISHNQNRVLDVAGIAPASLSGGASVGTFLGYPLGTFNMVRWAGVDATTGNEKVLDKDGNERIAKDMTSTELAAARVGIFDKPASPKAFGGLTNNFSFKSFDLSILFTFSVGQWLYDEGERKSSYYTSNNINLRSTATDRWTPANQGAEYPKLYYNDAVNDPLRNTNTTRFLHNASYARLKTLQLGYNLPLSILNKIKASKVRIYATGQNLLTFTKFPGWDPENVKDLGGLDNAGVQARNLGQGFTEYNLPQVRTFIIGASFGF